jgi:hypothetical protein
MYENGRGVARDNAEAVRLYRLAAEQGNAEGQASLGFMYANGLGVGLDRAEALRWYRLAANQGNTEAQGYVATHSSAATPLPPTVSAGNAASPIITIEDAKRTIAGRYYFSQANGNNRREIQFTSDSLVCITFGRVLQSTRFIYARRSDRDTLRHSDNQYPIINSASISIEREPLSNRMMAMITCDGLNGSGGFGFGLYVYNDRLVSYSSVGSRVRVEFVFMAADAPRQEEQIVSPAPTRSLARTLREAAALQNLSEQEGDEVCRNGLRAYISEMKSDDRRRSRVFFHNTTVPSTQDIRIQHRLINVDSTGSSVGIRRILSASIRLENSQNFQNQQTANYQFIFDCRHYYLGHIEANITQFAYFSNFIHQNEDGEDFRRRWQGTFYTRQGDIFDSVGNFGPSWMRNTANGLQMQAELEPFLRTTIVTNDSNLPVSTNSGQVQRDQVPPSLPSEENLNVTTLAGARRAVAGRRFEWIYREEPYLPTRWQLGFSGDGTSCTLSSRPMRQDGSESHLHSFSNPTVFRTARYTDTDEQYVAVGGCTQSGVLYIVSKNGNDLVINVWLASLSRPIIANIRQ